MKNSIFYGGYNFLNVLPIYWYLLIYAAEYLLLLAGRRYFEGKAYDVAFSSKFGCAFLAIFIFIAARTIQRTNFSPEDWMTGKNFQIIVAAFSILAAIIFYLVTKPKQVMDKYWFTYFICPVFIYLVLTTIPLYIKYASVKEAAAGFVLLILWLLSVLYDIKHERLNQRGWLRKHKSRDYNQEFNN
jgi:hypothetical protein